MASSSSSERRIILITRRTRLEELTARYNTVSQAKFYVEHLGADFGDYQTEDATYHTAVDRSLQILGRFGRVTELHRDYLPTYLFGPDDLVVAIGQDGLVANTLKYLNGQPLVGVNPDPARWDGVLLPFQVETLESAMPAIIENRRPVQNVTLAQTTLNTGEVLYAVNDFFIGPRSHTSARYEIELGPTHEYHSSSGIIVSTGVGSTAWFKSIVTGSLAVASALQGFDVQAQTPQVPWDAQWLYFAVREPFPSARSQTSLVFGQVTREQPLVLVSQMAEGGVIFSDGIETDFLEFRSGTCATITIADRVGKLVV